MQLYGMYACALHIALQQTLNETKCLDHSYTSSFSCTNTYFALKMHAMSMF